MSEMVKMGQADAAADLLADLAQRGPDIACDVIVQLANQVLSHPTCCAQSTMSVWLLRLLANVSDNAG